MKDFYNDSFEFLKTEKGIRKLENIILCSWNHYCESDQATKKYFTDLLKTQLKFLQCSPQ